MKKITALILMVACLYGISSSGGVSLKSWTRYLKTFANDTTRVVTADLADTLTIYHNGAMWVIEPLGKAIWTQSDDTVYFEVGSHKFLIEYDSVTKYVLMRPFDNSDDTLLMDADVVFNQFIRLNDDYFYDFAGGLSVNSLGVLVSQWEARDSQTIVHVPDSTGDTMFFIKQIASYNQIIGDTTGGRAFELTTPSEAPFIDMYDNPTGGRMETYADTTVIGTNSNAITIHEDTIDFDGMVFEDVDSIDASAIYYKDGTRVDYIIDSTLNPGVLETITVADDGGLDISWSAGVVYTPEGNIVITTSGNVTCTDNAINYLTWTTGTGLTVATTQPTLAKVSVATICCQDGDIQNGIHIESLASVVVHSLRHGLAELMPVLVATGLIVSEDADVTNPLDVENTAGEFYTDGHEEHEVSVIESIITPLVRWFHSSGTWTSNTDAEINPNYYDNLTDTVTVTSNRWTRSVFIITDDDIHWVFGQAEHVLETTALTADNPTIPEGLACFPVCAALVIQQGATDFTGATFLDIRPSLGNIVFGSGNPVSDHGSLTGLADDDHPQYGILADNETILGNWVNTTNPWADNEIASSATWNRWGFLNDTTALVDEDGDSTMIILDDDAGNVTWGIGENQVSLTIDGGSTSNRSWIFNDTVLFGDTTTDIDIVTMYRNSTDSGGFQYDAATNRMQFSNDGGATWADVSSAGAGIDSNDVMQIIRDTTYIDSALTGVVIRDTADLLYEPLNGDLVTDAILTDTLDSYFDTTATRVEIDLIADDTLSYQNAVDTIAAWDNGALENGVRADIGDTINVRMVKAVTGNTETGIAVTYNPSDSTNDYIVDSDIVAHTLDSNEVMVIIRDSTIHHLRAAIVDPDANYTNDSVVCIWAKTDAAITITGYYVTLDADPATEIQYSLKWSDAYKALGAGTIIDDTATVAGETTVTAGMGDPTIASAKVIYLLWDADPDDDVKSFNIDILYTYD